MATRKRVAQSASDEDANEGADAQDDGMPGIDDEGSASILNTTARKRDAMPTRSPRGTLMQKFTFGLLGGVTAEQDKHITGNGHDDEGGLGAEFGEGVQAHIEGEAGKPINEKGGREEDTEISRGNVLHEEDRSATPTPTSPSKRKRDKVGDISEEREDFPSKPFTRARKAKKPIIAPVTSLGDDFDVEIRAPRVKQVRTATIENTNPKQQPPPKRNRGRPRKTKPDAEVLEPNQPPSIKKRKGRQFKNPTPEPQPSASEESGPQAPISRSPPDEGHSTPAIPIVGIPLELGTVSPILENPSPQKKSPVKLTREDVGLPPISKLGSHAAALELQYISDDEEEEAAGPEDEPNLACPQLYYFAIERNLLDDLIEEAGWVGHKQNKKTKHYDEIWVVKKPHSKAGPAIAAQLHNLSDVYEELRRLKTESNAAESRPRAKIVECLGRLDRRTQSTMKTKLADPLLDTNGPDDETIKKTLIDLYFIVLPKWLQCIKIAIEVYDEDGFMSLTSLEQMQTLLKLYCNLANAALQQSTQPKAIDIIPEKYSNRSRQFRIKQPTKDVLQQVQQLRLKFTRKIKAIAREERDVEKQEVEASREQLQSEYQESVQTSRLEEARAKRLEREAKQRGIDEAKIRQKEEQIKLRHKEQARDWARIKAANARYNATTRKRYGNLEKAQGVPESRYPYGHDEEGGDLNDPFSDNFPSNYQRIKVFPSNNKSDTTAVEWTGDNMEIFIECMSRGSQDAKRYEDAATLIGCSIEQVFEAAKELQETYDRMHENGEMNGEDDGFSYDVWVETENG